MQQKFKKISKATFPLIALLIFVEAITRSVVLPKWFIGLYFLFFAAGWLIYGFSTLIAAQLDKYSSRGHSQKQKVIKLLIYFSPILFLILFAVASIVLVLIDHFIIN